MNLYLHQRTLEKQATFSGFGVHSGKKVNLTLKPAPPNHGIRFIRTDLPDFPSITPHFNMVVDTSLATVIGYNGCIVSTIEHLMAAFSGLSIDNAIVELDSYEVPIMDGSAMPFTDLIRFAGIKEQAGPRCFFVVKDTIELRFGDKYVCAYPASSFKITCTIDFPHPAIQNQTLTVDVTEDVFEKEIAPSRTFGFIHEIEYLIKHGFAKGGSLDNTIVLDQKGILNENPLRYPDEFVRHKILDCIGDFSLLGMPILGHIVLKKSGHAFNHAFLNEFFKKKGSWETLTIYDFNDISWNLPKALAI